MGSRWVCLDVREAGASFSVGATGWRRRHLSEPASVTFPRTGRGRSRPEESWSERTGVIAAELRRLRATDSRRLNGLLAALPDAWFRIGLVEMKTTKAGGGLRDYARWKIKADWNMEAEDTVFDWQAVSRARRKQQTVLLVAAGKDLLQEVAKLGTAVEMPVTLVVPRCVAAWNSLGLGATAGGLRAYTLLDDNSFSFFGSEGGRLRYVRSKACDGRKECEVEIGETVRHFREVVGSDAPQLHRTDWSDTPSLPVMSGLLRHPLFGGVLA